MKECKSNKSCKSKKSECSRPMSEEELKKVSGGANPFDDVDRVDNSEYDNDVKNNI